MTGRMWLAMGALCLAATTERAGATVDAGQPCGMNTTGALDSHLGHQTGELHGGPWLVSDGDDVRVTCEIEFANTNCYDTADGSRITSDPRPYVGLLPPLLVEFWNPYQQPIFVGTTITWSYADGSAAVRTVDFDPSKPGAQCAVFTWGNEG